jgi:tetratricopeptide (TPR) repeat protein
MTKANVSAARRRGAAIAVPLAAAAFFLALYAKTACPAAYWQDSGIYARSVCLLGNCYAPGYPAYLCSSYIFTALPGLDAVAGLNLFSAAAGAAAAFFVALAALRLYGGAFSVAGAAVAALALGAAPAVWAQATVAEVYTLSIALTGATVWLLLRWGGGPDDRPLWAAAFVYGLACGVHPQQAAFLPAYATYAFWAGGRRLLSPRNLGIAAAAFALALSAYLYLPVRSAAGVAVDWGKPDNLKNFYAHVTGKMYRGELFAGTAALVAARARTAADVFLSQSGWLGLAAGIGGAAWLFMRRLRAAVLLFGAAAVSAAFILNYHSANWRTWYAGLYMAWALACGAFVAWLGGRLARWRFAAGLVVSVIAVVVAGAAAATRFGPADRSYFPYAEDAAGNVFRVVGPRATFILSYEGSAVTGPLAALVTAAYARPDVYFIDAAGTRQFHDFFELAGAKYRDSSEGITPEEYVAAFLRLVGDRRRDYYVLYPFAPPRYYGYGYEKRGRVWRLVPPGEMAARGDWWALYRRRGVEPAPPAYVDYWTGTYLGVQYVGEARDRAAEGELSRAAACLALAERLGRRAEKARANLGAYYETRGDLPRAAEHYRAALALEPTFYKARESLARVYARMGREEEAARELESLSRLYPEGEEPWGKR